MRVAPRPLITVGLVLGYMAVVGVVWVFFGLDYDDVGTSTRSVVEGIVVPIALGAVFLAVSTTLLGWWGPALRESLGASRWMWLVPILMALPGIGFVLGGSGAAERSGGFLIALGVGCLLVGFSEELLTRGTGLVGLRGGFGEALSWFFSCLIFGLIHALNAAFGQSIGSTVQQIGFAFLAGSVLYVTRRVSGTLVVCMVLHAWIDFTTFAFADAAVDEASPVVALAGAQWLAFVLALVGVAVLLRRSGAPSSPSASLSAA